MKGPQTRGLIELASFREFDHYTVQVLQALSENIAEILEDQFVKIE
jgi:hypothetical protein